MVKADNVRTWVSGEIYLSLLCGLTKNLNLKINSESVPDVLFQHDANKINCADLKLHNLESVARKPEVVCKYVSQKLKFLGGQLMSRKVKARRMKRRWFSKHMHFIRIF